MSYPYRIMNTLIRSTALMGYIELVQELGGDPEALLQRFLIDPEKVRTHEGVISHGAMINLLEETARDLDRPDFGLQLSHKQDLMVLGPLAVIALNAPTVGRALEQIIRYMHYYAPGVLMELHWDVEPGISRMSFDQATKIKKIGQIMDLTLGVADNSLKMLYDKTFRAERVMIRGDSPVSIREYFVRFDAPVCKQQQYYALMLKTVVLEKPINQSDPNIHDMLESFVQNALRDQPLTIPAQVEHLIAELLPTNCCNLKTIASQLGFQPRTLQRHLGSASLSFDELLDRARREKTLQYLAEKDMPIAQVACLVGYADSTTFSRACKRWFGVPPIKRRQQLLSKL